MTMVAIESGSVAATADETLAVKASKDFEAFTELYRRYLCPVYRYIRSQTPNDTAAEDITAHVFFKALASAASFRGQGSYKSWIFRIARNTVSSWRGSERRSVTVEEMPESIDPVPCPAAQAISQERRGLVWKAIADLSPAQREVVALHYIEDMSTEEVAAITGRSRGAVRILLHRGRSKLRSALEPDQTS